MSLYGMAMGAPWSAGFLFWGVKLPYLVVTPIVQLALAALFFEGMARKLRSPLDPMLSKLQAYALLIVVDVVAAGILFGNIPLDGLNVMSVEFCLVHLVAGLIVIMIVTPRGEAYLSWVWRLRGRSTWLRDSWLGARSTLCRHSDWLMTRISAKSSKRCGASTAGRSQSSLKHTLGQARAAKLATW